MAFTKNISVYYGHSARLHLGLCKHLVNLKSILLSNNFIEFIRDEDFKFSSNIQSIDLNSNLIKSIQENSFDYLSSLKSFKSIIT
jgi:hypothetical protein